MRVLYFAFEGFDSPNGTNHLALALIEGLLDNNHSVHLLSSRSRGIENDVPASLLDRANFSYDIVPRTKVDKQNFVKRYIEGVWYSLRCSRKWYRIRKNVDVVVLQSTPTAVWSSILMKMFLGKPIVYNYYDLFPDGGYAMGVIGETAFRLLAFLQKALYKASSKIVVASDDMRETLIKQGIEKQKLVKINLWYDDQLAKIIFDDDNAFLKKYPKSINGFYVQYAGNFGYTFDYKMVLEVAERTLNSGNHNIIFQMIGDGAFAEQFQEEARLRGLTNVEFLPWQPLDTIADVNAACSLGFIPLAKGVIWNSYPSKSSLLMAIGKPLVIVAEEASVFSKMINESGVGECFDHTQIAKITESIIRLSKNQELATKYGNSGKEFAVRYYSSSDCVMQYVSLLEHIVHEQGLRVVE